MVNTTYDWNNYKIFSDILCDKCGRPTMIKSKLTDHSPNYDVTIRDNPITQYLRTFDLCKDCINKLEEWLKIQEVY